VRRPRRGFGQRGGVASVRGAVRDGFRHGSCHPFTRNNTSLFLLCKQVDPRSFPARSLRMGARFARILRAMARAVDRARAAPALPPRSSARLLMGGSRFPIFFVRTCCCGLVPYGRTKPIGRFGRVR
jgi:hypothetical protein